ncbi:hypothetical protein ACFRAM_28560 [Paenibacillus sp. NPDC056722]|uniref:hypothetical protein n=1 Tax=Paenibacillus sp. NPDC056722 TaxID=3345924 RepID=UPI0036C85A7B
MNARLTFKRLTSTDVTRYEAESGQLKFTIARDQKGWVLTITPRTGRRVIHERGGRTKRDLERHAHNWLAKNPPVLLQFRKGAAPGVYVAENERFVFEVRRRDWETEGRRRSAETRWCLTVRKDDQIECEDVSSLRKDAFSAAERWLSAQLGVPYGRPDEQRRNRYPTAQTFQ